MIENNIVDWRTFSILLCIEKKPTYVLSIRKEANLTETITYKLINEIYDFGLIEMFVDRRDRRTRMYRLTERGRKVLGLFKELNKILSEIEDE